MYTVGTIHSESSIHLVSLFYSPSLFTETISLFFLKKKTPKSGCAYLKEQKSYRQTLEQKGLLTLERLSNPSWCEYKTGEPRGTGRLRRKKHSMCKSLEGAG